MVKKARVLSKQPIPIWLLVLALVASGAGAAAGRVLSGKVTGEVPVTVSQALLVGKPSATWTKDWTKDTANPVFTRGVMSGAPSVIYDSAAGKYKMWYTRETANLSTFDGLMSDIAALGITSLVNHLKNRNFSAVVNDSTNITAIIDYLAGLNTNELQNIISGTSSTISYATSPDGTTWQFQSDVLPTGSAGQWDAFFVGTPSVIRNSASSYEMWYTGASVSVTAIETFLDDLSLLSSDNISTLLQDIIVNKNIPAFITHARAALGDPYLISLISDIINVLNGTNLAIGHATSSDGVNWVKDTNNPILQKGTGSAWDKHGVATPSVIRDSSGNYQMWYTGFGVDYATLVGLLTATNLNAVESTILAATNLAIGHATSTNGVSWTKDTSNPVLSKGAGDVWDKYGVATPSVIRDSSGNYQMWYTGVKMVPSTLRNFLGGTSSFESALINSTNSAIGHATSTNGVSWTKDTSNPVLSKGTGEMWDKYGVSAPSVSRIGNLYRMFYTGAGGRLSTFIVDVLDGNSLTTALADSNTRIAVGHAVTTVVATKSGHDLKTDGAPQTIYKKDSTTLIIATEPRRHIETISDDHTVFQVSAEIGTGDAFMLSLPFKNASSKDLVAELTLTFANRLSVEVYAPTSAIRISQLVRSELNTWKLKVAKGADYDTTKDRINVVVAATDELMAGFYTLKGEIKQTN